MTVKAIDGFDIYPSITATNGLQSKWVCAATGSLSLVTGRFSGQGLRTTSNGLASRTFNGAVSTFTCGIAVKFATFGATMTAPWCFLGANGTVFQLMFMVYATGVIEVYRGNTSIYNGILLGSSAAGVIVVNTWHYIEHEIVIHDTTGSVKIKVDGVTVINLTGIDTKNGSTTTVDTIRLGTTDGGGGDRTWDDLYITDLSSSPGERRIELIVPSADTAQKDWTASTGVNNYACVDEVPCSDSDYVQGTTVGNLDLYDLTNLSTTPATIDAIQVNQFGWKTDAASRAIAPVIDLSGSQLQGADQALATTTTKGENIFETKPGGGAWDATAVNALKAGPKVTV